MAVLIFFIVSACGSNKGSEDSGPNQADGSLSAGDSSFQQRPDASDSGPGTLHGGLQSDGGQGQAADAGPHNQIINGSFDMLGDGWLGPWTFGFDWTYLTARAEQDTSTHVDGTASLRITVYGSDVTAPSYGVHLAQDRLTTKAGTTYTIGFWVRGSTRVGVTVKKSSAPNTVYFTADVDATSTWQKATFMMTAPATDNDVTLEINCCVDISSVQIDSVSMVP